MFIINASRSKPLFERKITQTRRPFMLRFLVALLLSISPLALSAEPASKIQTSAEPASKIQSSYDILGFGIKLATLTETFTRTKDSYQIETVTIAVGLLARIKPETIRVTSHGKITSQGLIPLDYALSRLVDTHKNTSAKFNWETSTLTHNDNKGLRDLTLSKGTQDRLSLLYHLPLAFMSDQVELKLSITDGNNLDAYSFSLAPDEQEVTVPLDTFKTRYVTSTALAESVKYEIWMATERDNFPCKIVVTDAKGGKLTQVLTQLTITP